MENDQNQASIDIVVRVSPSKMLTSPETMPLPLDSVNDLLKIPAHEDLLQYVAQIKNGTSPFILFTEQAIEALEGGVSRALRFMLGQPQSIGLTLETPTLGTVYGATRSQSPPRRLATHTRKIDVLPAWFSMVRRDAFLQSDALDHNYKTLEFSLLHYSCWAHSRNVFLSALSVGDLKADARTLVESMLTNRSHMLAQDYEQFRSHWGDSYCPPQLRIESLGRFFHISSDKPGIAACEVAPVKFSILCPTYKATYFEEALTSVVNQSYQNWEFIALIDGPRKKERDLIRAKLDDYACDSRIRSYEQENKGTGAARRRLATLAKGDFVVTLDDDDMLTPNTLESFAVAIRENPDIKILRGGTQLIGKVEKYLQPRKRIVVDGVSADLFEVNQPFAIARETLKELGGFRGDERFRMAGEDSAFFLTENSPCIDAGDPSSPPDPDSTIADIGAFYFDQTQVIEDLTITIFNDDVMLDWEDVPWAAVYHIYRSQTPYFEVSGMTPIGGSETSEYLDENILEEGPQFYRVTWE